MHSAYGAARRGFLSLSLLAGCPGGGGETASSTGSTATGSTGSTGSTGTSGGSTGGTTMSPTTGASATGSTGSTGSTSGAPATGSSGAPETGTTGEGSSSGGSTTGGIGGGACTVDDDCQLHNDCCDCYGEPVEAMNPLCDLLCDQPMCDAIGIKKAVCRFGQCATEKVQCSGDVSCDAPTPDCPEGTLPEIQGTCWSGACVPVLACDAVPDCALCPTGTMCVAYQGKPSKNVCEPIPGECAGDPSCACAEALACIDPYTLCSDGTMGEVVCGCPTC